MVVFVPNNFNSYCNTNYTISHKIQKKSDNSNKKNIFFITPINKVNSIKTESSNSGNKIVKPSKINNYKVILK